MKRSGGSISASALREHIRRVEGELNLIEDQRSSLDARAAELAVRRDTLVGLLHELRPDTGGANDGSATSLTQAMVDYLVKNPGAKASDVVDAVIETVTTKAKKPRKNLHQTILNLKKRGRIVADENGGLKVATAPSR